MESPLGLSLLITAIGMGLVFGCILLFWGLMSLLMRLAPWRPSEGRPQPEEPAPDAAGEEGGRERQAEAAAVAVAVALASRPGRPARRASGTAALSPWQAAHRRAQPGGRRTVE